MKINAYLHLFLFQTLTSREVLMLTIYRDAHLDLPNYYSTAPSPALLSSSNIIKSIDDILITECVLKCKRSKVKCRSIGFQGVKGGPYGRCVMIKGIEQKAFNSTQLRKGNFLIMEINHDRLRICRLLNDKFTFQG